ncbi:DNA-repair protein XRCC1 [Bienertia sinuspersici]
MSSSKASPKTGTDKTPKRALPSWMSARDDSKGNKQVDDKVDDDNQVETSHISVRGQGKGAKVKGEESGNRKKSEFSKLLEGVVFALSGFVNPERGTLRSQALEMGAEYQPDWNSNCTLLICAFPNTPKFRQVEADGGTIVSKDWITECYTQKKLVDIETYLMHIGKPWKKNNTTHTGNEELRGNTSICLKDKFSASKVKKWAIDDLNKTLTWLESQEEKNLQHLTEQWSMVPRVVEELLQVQGSESSSSISKDGLRKQAIVCKKIYEKELKGMMMYDDSNEKNEEPKCKSHNTGKGKHSSTDDIASKSMDYDSDETIEMTEDEINDAYHNLASKLPRS